jgi:NADH:ubiquinone oxidoreductase subunit F (NADH-binding)
MPARDTTEGFLLPPVPLRSLGEYEAVGGGEGLARAQEIGPDLTLKEVQLSGLRGRGGAGFPTGRKWTTIRSAAGSAKYAVVNAAEGEPGTFKDRALLRANPYQLVEGLAIAALAVGTADAYIGVKASFEAETAALRRAVEEMAAAGMLGDLTVNIVTGPDEYLFGEEKALLEVIEGNAPLPRLFPPYQHGLFATGIQMGWQASVGTPDEAHPDPHPTLVNNVETLSNVPHILRKGAEWYRSFGTDASPGIVVATVVGDVVRAGVGEVELGVPLRDVIETISGGVLDGRRLKAVFSGVSNPVLTEAQLDLPLTYEDFAAAGTGLGACGFIVYDDSACMVEVARLFSQFLAVESCGQCPACKLGTAAITEHLNAVELGAGNDDDITTIGGRLRTVTDGNRCALPQEEQNVVGSLMTRFPDEFAEHLERGRCPRPRPLVMPKLVDIVEGRAVYDERYRYKQPDWTYADEVGARA